MDLNPNITILKLLFFAAVTTILIIFVYGYLANLASVSGGKQIKTQVELTPENKRAPSW